MMSHGGHEGSIDNIKIVDKIDFETKLPEVIDKVDNFDNLHKLFGTRYDGQDPGKIYYVPIDPNNNYKIGSTTYYPFENVYFTTDDSDANAKEYRPNTTYAYMDPWGNRRYTFSRSYTPNIDTKDTKIYTLAELAATTSEDVKEKNMAESIKLEAKFKTNKFYHSARNFSLAAGSNVTVDGLGATGAGYETFVTGIAASSFGIGNLVRAKGAAAFGTNNIVTGIHSIAFNEGNFVAGYAAASFGDHNTVTGAHSLGTGWKNTSSGQYNMFGGNENTLAGTHNFVIGGKNVYDGFYNLGGGLQNTVNGNYNITTGYTNTVYGHQNSVNGQKNIVGKIVDGEYLISSNNTINGIGNEIVRINKLDSTGKEIVSTGHIINGVNNKINVTNKSTYRNIVNGEANTIGENDADNIRCTGYALVSGVSNIVKSTYGAAIGKGLDVQGHYGAQLVIGQYNKMDKWAMFVVGQGKSDTDRKNVFTVKNDGQGIFTGTVTAADPTQGTHLTTKKYVDNAIANIGGGLPTVNAADNGKFLMVVDGAWAAVTIPQAEEAEF
jgi:hypothetical protein